MEKAEGWQLASDPDYARWVRQLFPAPKPARLTPPALETLAIIAYRQPITRADVEAVRGVAIDGVLQTLMERGLVKIAGRAEIPGRPLLYETTQFFLDHFGLRNLDELPNAEELRTRYLPAAPRPPLAPEAALRPNSRAIRNVVRQITTKIAKITEYFMIFRSCTSWFGIGVFALVHRDRNIDIFVLPIFSPATARAPRITPKRIAAFPFWSFKMTRPFSSITGMAAVRTCAGQSLAERKAFGASPRFAPCATA